MKNDDITRYCLTADDIYSYIVGAGAKTRLLEVEAHLAECAHCGQELAELLRMLRPEPEQPAGEIAEPSETELEEMVALVQQVDKRERARAGRAYRWQRWSFAAAAAISVLAISLWGLKYIYEKHKSETFYAQAKASLEESYSGKSPSNLRLALPFSPATSSRGLADRDSLSRAEGLFNQALGVREGMVEARLGIAFIYLSESQFARARAEFQTVLSASNGNTQALLGRGVAQYEEALQAADPVQRSASLAGALNDINAVLALTPLSAEARYDRAWIFFECGRHQEALQEIEKYLARDSGSVWAEELKNLRTRIQAAKSSAVEDKVSKAARSRDRAVLEELARLAPYQMAAAIRSALRRSLEPNSAEGAAKGLSSEDLSWAAQVMEATYRATTGDQSFKTLFEFYAALSPSQRALKKDLDGRLQASVNLHLKRDWTAAMRSSSSLEQQFAGLKDFWQICNIHQLRANCLYYGKADFELVRAEYQKMLEIAEHIPSTDLTAKALGGLALTYEEQRKFDDGIRCAEELKKLALQYRLDSWQAYSCMVLGSLFGRLGRLDRSLREYTTALSIAYLIQDEGILIATLENSGLVMDRLGRLQDARDSYREAYEQQDLFVRGQTEETDPGIILQRLNLLYKQGDLALRMGDPAAAEALFRESLKSAPEGMRELEARNRIGLAQIYLSQKRIQEAEMMLADIQTPGKYPEIDWQASFVRGELLEERGDHSGALASLQQAIRVLEQMRRNINPGDLRQTFLTGRFDPYQAVVAILYQSLNNPHQALEFIDRAKSITLREHLRLLGLTPGSAESLPRSEGAIAKRSSPMMVLEYFFIKDRLLIFLDTHGGLQTVTQKISAQELDRQVRAFSESVTRGDVAAFTARSRRLFAELIAPIQKDLFAEPLETLVILPDGPLHLLPFAGLQDEQGRFLIERVPLAVAPSRSILRHCLALGESRVSAGGHSIALIDASANLPGARDELACLLRLYGNNARLLTPKEMNPRAAGQAVANSEIIHFAGHSTTLQGKPVLVLQPPPAEAYLDGPAISAWKLSRARLVYLAGCSTGIGLPAEGESPWGLIPAFLDAGAPAIVASLLPVDDASTQMLTSRFYELLYQGTTAATALQKAQLTLLNAGRSRDNLKPQSWIPYILVGNPR
jgi:CHAT domain-containing protein